MARRIFLTVLLVACALCTEAQRGKSTAELNNQIKKAEQDIARNTALLNTTLANKSASQLELKLIQDRINSRRKIVSALQQQIDGLNRNISADRTSVNRLEAERDKLTSEYSSMIRESYRNYLQNNYLALLFASKDFDDATRRINYIRRYNALRERKANQIDSLTVQIAQRIEQLNEQVSELDQTKSTQTGEIKTLGTEEKQYQTTLTSLKSTETKLASQIKASQKQIDAAQKEIARIIAEENKKEGKKVLTAEQQREVTALTGRFDQNKGKLPYPVKGGVIIDHHGKHPHPTQKGVNEENTGINIAAAKGAQVRSVFEGTVSRVGFLRGLNNVVIVRHGSYVTAYGNLSSVSVKVGEKVALNQSLGTLSEGNNTDQHMVHFEIWKEEENLDPEPWLIP